MHRGETRTFHVELNDQQGDDVSLAGAGLQFVAYVDPDTPVVDVAATVTDADEGLADVVVPAAATEEMPTTKNTTLYYVLRRTVGGFTDVVDAGLLIIRAQA